MLAQSVTFCTEKFVLDNIDLFTITLSWAQYDWNTVEKVMKQENEPPHDKTNKMTVCPAKTRISLGIRLVWSESGGCPG